MKSTQSLKNKVNLQKNKSFISEPVERSCELFVSSMSYSFLSCQKSRDANRPKVLL